MKTHWLFGRDPQHGDVIEWWATHHHPVEPYVRRYRATFYERAECSDVIGEHGAPFDHQWLIESWYEPGGSKTSGGRNTTDGLRHHLASSDGGSKHATWEGARDAVVAGMQRRAAEHRSAAESLERAAIRLSEAIQ